jgi:hypothetical protein
MLLSNFVHTIVKSESDTDQEFDVKYRVFDVNLPNKNVYSLLIVNYV